MNRIDDLLFGDETMDASPRVSNGGDSLQQPAAAAQPVQPQFAPPVQHMAPPVQHMAPPVQPQFAPPVQQAAAPPPLAPAVPIAQAAPVAGVPGAPQTVPRQGNSLLLDAVQRGKITQQEALILQKTLAEAKRQSVLDPTVKPKDYVTSTLRRQLGDDRARAVISAVAAPTPRGRAQAQGAPQAQIQAQHAATAPTAAPTSAPAPIAAPVVVPPRAMSQPTHDARSPPPAAAGGRAASPPGQAPEGGAEAPAKATKKRGPRPSTDDAAASGRKRAAKGPTAPTAQPSVASALKKADYDLDPVNIEEYQAVGLRPGGAARGGKGEAAAGLLESVLPSDLVGAEEKRARDERRAAVEVTHPSAGLRVGGNILGGGLFSAAQHHASSSWDNGAVMTRAKILSISEQILGVSGPPMSLDEDAVKYIAFATQNMLSDIIESSITASRRRRNQTAVQQFEKIQQLMNLPHNEKGVPIPEHGHNLGMGWSTDLEEKTLSEGRAFVEDYNKRASDYKEQVKNDLIKYDEERKLSGKKRQLNGVAVAAEQNDAWWTQDAEAEKNGLLSWSEISLAQFRLKVAEEFELGPYRQRRRASRGGNRGEEGGDAMVVTTDGQSSTPSIPAASVVGITAAAPSRSSAEWAPVRCPLFTEEGDVVSKADVLRNLSKRTKTRSCGGYFAERLGDSLYRAKIGLPPKAA